jgi:Big-like domain-containing protein
MKRSSLAIALFASTLAGTVLAATITVTGTGDAIAVDGLASLREAIASINSGADVNADVTLNRVGPYGSSDAIQFNISGCGGVCTIATTAALPTVVVPMTIDGYTQPGASANSLAVGDNAVILITIDGTGAGAGTDGLTVSNHSVSRIRGLNIANFGGNGILITGTGGAHIVEGNFIGTNAAGTAAAGNGADGVKIFGVPGNTIGGISPGERNVISANGQANVFAGIEIRESGAFTNIVFGNYIGTDKSGTAALGNSKTFGFGVIIFNSASHNFVGGNLAGAGNVISDNGSGVSIQAANSNAIQGNFIGTDASGSFAIGNHFDGIDIIGTSSGNSIGGAAAGQRNVISGNAASGVLIGGCGGNNSTIQGNFIGTDAAGTSAIPNGLHGIFVRVDHHDSLIGGIGVLGEGNVIAFNTAVGVAFENSNSCGTIAHNIAVRGNSIHDNGLLGIDLAVDGVTANDAGDGDSGPNNLQNFPVITLAVSNGPLTTVTGTLNSAPSTTYTLEFFSSPTCDASGNGEGKTLLGVLTTTTDVAGNGTFGQLFGTATSGQVLTATATDPSNNTSEFSACVATIPPLPSTTTLTSLPNPSILGQNVTFTATVTGGGPTPVGDPVTFRDGPTTLGVVLSNAFGQATLTTSALSLGPHTMTASYSGDAVYTPSTGTMIQTVNPGLVSATTLTSSLNPSTFGQTVTFTATVTGGGPTPTGPATFKDGPTTLAIVSLNGAGQATFTTSALTVGPHTITVDYGGDGTYAGSTSPPVTQVVTGGASSAAIPSLDARGLIALAIALALLGGLLSRKT